MNKRSADEAGDGAQHHKVPRLDSANGTTLAADAARAALKRADPPPVVYYREGRPMRELATFYRNDRHCVEVVVPSDYMSSNNKQVKARQLWGDHVYTDDSDLVAVLMHLGYYATHNANLPSQVVEFHAVLGLLPPRDKYTSCFRNSVRSRAWFAKVDGCSFQVEQCWLVTRSGSKVALTPSADDSASGRPTFAPAAGDRQISTRSSGGRPKGVSEVSVLYNLANEPWFKYSMAVVADRGLKPRACTSGRLHTEVLYLEDHTERYEVSYQGVQGEGSQQREVFQFARCKRAASLAVMRQLGMPLPASELDVLERNLAWDELQWGNLTVRVRGREIKVVRLQFLKQVKPEDV